MERRHDAERSSLDLARRSAARAADGGAKTFQPGDKLLARVRKMLGPRSRRAADSLDFVQEAWAEFLASPAARESCDESSLLRRLGAIARNNVRDAARRCSPERFESALGLDADADEFELDQTSPGSALDRAEQFALAVGAARALPAPLFEVFALRCFEGLTFPRIAERLARNEDTVRKQYYRAVVRLSRRGS